VDLECQDKKGRTALLCAIDGYGCGSRSVRRAGLKAMVRQLMKEGADIHATNKGRTDIATLKAVHLAVHYANRTAVDRPMAIAPLLGEGARARFQGQ
jgi:hypothetical protein